MDNQILVSSNDIKSIVKCVKKVSDIEGCFIEVGVFFGGTAELIGLVKENDRELYLFDNFNGLDKCLPIDKPFTNGMYKGDYNVVCNLMKQFNNTQVIEGWFPDSAGILKDRKISFAHLDVDTYMSTLESLFFIYPLMSTGGIILVHDYPGNFNGITNAVDEFFSDKIEKPQKYGDFYGIITKQ